MRRLTLALTMALPLATISAGESQAQQVPVSGRPIPTPPEEPPPLDPMGAARSPRHLLRNGQDYIRYREFDRALVLFREAESRKSELTAAESKELSQAIEAALKGLHEPAPSRGPIAGAEPQPGTIALAEPSPGPTPALPPMPASPPISPDGIQLTSATVSEAAEMPADLPIAEPEPAPEPQPIPTPTPDPAPAPIEPIAVEDATLDLPQLPLGNEAPETPDLLMDSSPTPPVSPLPLEEPDEIGFSMPPTFSSSPAALTSPEPLPPLPPPADELLSPEAPEVLENGASAESEPGPISSAPASMPVTTALERDQEYVNTLSPELRRRVEQIARRQEEEEQLRGLPPYDMLRPIGDDDPTFTSLELPRAPSPTEPIPIESIPVPEEFEPISPREWSPRRKYWAAAATCHGPLYFQDAVLERYGQGVEQSVGPIGRFLSYPLDDPTQTQQRNQIAQPFVSAGLFAAQIVLWPYNMIMDPPGEAEYDLGYHRPGDRIPPGTIYLPPYGVGPALRGKHY